MVFFHSYVAVYQRVFVTPIGWVDHPGHHSNARGGSTVQDQEIKVIDSRGQMSPWLQMGLSGCPWLIYTAKMVIT